MAEDYNRVTISPESMYYRYNKEFYGKDKDENPSFSAAGVGLNYIHGFSLSKKLPMFLEVGGSINFNNDTQTVKMDEGYKEEVKVSTQYANLNIRIPVNFAWKFQLSEKHALTPYTGINFKFNCLTQFREGMTIDDRKVWSDWMSLLKKNEEKDINEEDIWNVFQMGWQIGVNWGIKRFNLGLEWGYDFIPAYNKTLRIYDFKETFKVHTSSVRFMVGYTF